MLVSKEEFLSIKTPLVEDVLKNLRELARLEGELLFREYSNYPGALPKFSERISYAINKVTDAITDALANVEPEDPLFKELLPLIHEILPAKLEEIAGDRISSKLPVQYQRNAIASRLASKIVYKEGIHLIEYQPDEELAKRAFAYYRAEKELESIISKVKADGTKSDPAVEGVVTDLLERGGARTYLRVF